MRTQARVVEMKALGDEQQKNKGTGSTCLPGYMLGAILARPQ